MKGYHPVPPIQGVENLILSTIQYEGHDEPSYLRVSQVFKLEKIFSQILCKDQYNENNISYQVDLIVLNFECSTCMTFSPKFNCLGVGN